MPAEMELMHTVLFVVMWVGALAFIVLQFNPLLKRTRKEVRGGEGCALAGLQAPIH